MVLTFGVCSSKWSIIWIWETRTFSQWSVDGKHVWKKVANLPHRQITGSCTCPCPTSGNNYRKQRPTLIRAKEITWELETALYLCLLGLRANEAYLVVQVEISDQLPQVGVTFPGLNFPQEELDDMLVVNIWAQRVGHGFQGWWGWWRVFLPEKTLK